MIKGNRATVFLLAVCLAFLSGLQPVWAHRVVITEHVPGELRVYYDGGTPAQRAQVVLYGPDRRVLASGGVDPNGVFRYDPKLKPVAAFAEDGLGHRGELIFGRVHQMDTIPLWVKLFFALALLSSIGAISYYYQKKVAVQAAGGSYGNKRGEGDANK